MRNPFGRLFHRRDRDEFSDIRSHVLNEKFGDRLNEFEQYPQMPPPTGPQPPQFMQAQGGYDDFTPKTRDVFAPFPTQQPPLQPGPDFAPAAEKVNRDYDIMDRLNIIESQLSAIRSQTELINERLKNMESRLGLGRRY